MFKTLEEANEWKLEQEKKYNQLLTAHEGLQTKLGETEKLIEEKASEIDRLKIKNYEYMEQISVQQAEPTPIGGQEPQEPEVNFNDFLSKF